VSSLSDIETHGYQRTNAAPINANSATTGARRPAAALLVGEGPELELEAEGEPEPETAGDVL
jgi:hypothetical protein